MIWRSTVWYEQGCDRIERIYQAQEASRRRSVEHGVVGGSACILLLSALIDLRLTVALGNETVDLQPDKTPLEHLLLCPKRERLARPSIRTMHARDRHPQTNRYSSL